MKHASAAAKHNSQQLECAGHLLQCQVLIEERDDAIQEISQQIGEVHEIFQV
jgi:hypothetical protein